MTERSKWFDGMGEDTLKKPGIHTVCAVAPYGDQQQQDTLPVHPRIPHVPGASFSGLLTH